MKKHNYLVRVIFILSVFFVFINKSEADRDGIGFQITPIFSDTQIDPDKGYYYVKTEPGVSQKLEMSIANTSDDPINIALIVTNAVSQSNGNLGYETEVEKTHESLQYPLTEILKPEKEVIEIPARESTIVTFNVTPPNEHYDGIKMGRIIVKEKTDDESKGISQEFQYASQVILSESGTAFNDGQTLQLEKVQANINFGSRAVEAHMVNPESKTIENLQVRSYVTKKGETTKIKESNFDDFSFAPNSEVDFLVPWGLTNFESGEYEFHFTAKNDLNTFEFIEPFKITGDSAKKLNSEAAFKVAIPYTIKYALIGINTLLVLLFIFVIKRNRGWVKELKTKKRNKGRNKGRKKNKR